MAIESWQYKDLHSYSTMGQSISSQVRGVLIVDGISCVCVAITVPGLVVLCRIVHIQGLVSIPFCAACASSPKCQYVSVEVARSKR